MFQITLNQFITKEKLFKNVHLWWLRVVKKNGELLLFLQKKCSFCSNCSASSPVLPRQPVDTWFLPCATPWLALSRDHALSNWPPPLPLSSWGQRGRKKWELLALWGIKGDPQSRMVIVHLVSAVHFSSRSQFTIDKSLDSKRLQQQLGGQRRGQQRRGWQRRWAREQRVQGQRQLWSPVAAVAIR